MLISNISKHSRKNHHMLKKIQYISDIHLEFFGQKHPIVKAVAPILCLAGDIGYPNMSNYKDFLIHLNSNKNFYKIFMIAGNHEYYKQNVTIEETNQQIEDIIKCNNLTKISFLNNKSILYNGYLFVGTTMWTKILDPCAKKINDFAYIKNMNIDKYNSLHNASIKFLQNEIISNQNKKIIVMTHHLPSYNLIDKKYDVYSDYRQYFASPCDNLIAPPVSTWIYGHTHTAHTSVVNNVILACNPIGYNRENKNANYEKIIDLP